MLAIKQVQTMYYILGKKTTQHDMHGILPKLQAIGLQVSLHRVWGRRHGAAFGRC